jgi:hypothetical protein
VMRDEIDATDSSPYRSPGHRVVAWSLEDASELQGAVRRMRRSSRRSMIGLSLPTFPRPTDLRLRHSSRRFSALLQKSPPGPRRLASMSIEMRLKVCAVLASRLMLGTYGAFGS